MSGDKRMVFGLGQDAAGEAVLLLGVPAAAWEHMKDGKTSHFDLAKAGLPLKVLVFGAATRNDCLKVIELHNSRVGVATFYEPGKNFGIDALNQKDSKS